MSQRRAFGTVTPSSNRTVERTVQAILPYFPQLDACFARIPLHANPFAGLGDPYDPEPFRQAAWMLGHAGVELVCWNGTKGAGLGLPADVALCAEMAAAAGVPATTAVLDIATLLQRLGATRLGLLVPGEVGYAHSSAAGFTPLGAELVAARGLDMPDNLASGAVPEARIAELLREMAAEAKPDALLVWSTNLHGWPVMAPLEAELGIPVIDSAAAGVWGCLAAMGIDPAPAAALGRIFRIPG